MAITGHEGKFGIALYHPNVIQICETGVRVTLILNDGEAEAEQQSSNLLQKQDTSRCLSTS